MQSRFSDRRFDSQCKHGSAGGSGQPVQPAHSPAAPAPATNQASAVDQLDVRPENRPPGPTQPPASQTGSSAAQPQSRQQARHTPASPSAAVLSGSAEAPVAGTRLAQPRQPSRPAFSPSEPVPKTPQPAVSLPVSSAVGPLSPSSPGSSSNAAASPLSSSPGQQAAAGRANGGAARRQQRPDPAMPPQPGLSGRATAGAQTPYTGPLTASRSAASAVSPLAARAAQSGAAAKPMAPSAGASSRQQGKPAGSPEGALLVRSPASDKAAQEGRLNRSTAAFDPLA